MNLVRLVLALLVLVRAGPAFAQEDPFEWLKPPPEDQLADDETVIPVGKGAVFVPTLTSPTSEPPVILVTPDDVKDIPTGRRVLVDPGTYTVIVSPGSPGQGIGQAIEVREGETTLVPVKWGALRVHVTDDRRVPFRGQYDLIKSENRETIGTGFGADTLQGEQLMTWLLPPGVYRIVKPGANYRALKNYATVYVPEAGLVRYRLVIDQQTGDFLGSGMLLPGEFGAGLDRDSRWAQTLVIGADGSFVQSANRGGVTNQTVLSGNVFVDHQIGYHKDAHHFTALIQLEEGATSIRPAGATPLPVLKTRDRIRGDLLYNWFARENIGPYARAGAETRMFNTNVLATEDSTFLITRTDGTVDSTSIAANETLNIARAWAPTVIREGAGMNYRAVNNRWVTFNLRLGLGARQNLYRRALFPADDPDTDTFEYQEVDSFFQEGVESTIVLTARLPGWAVYATDLELFADFQTFTQPSLEWRNTVTLRLTRLISLNYFANLDYLPQVVEDKPWQLEHSVVLRAAWTIL
ncbi:MAG: hypothetical protein H6737_15130 [Alphaproteobacteria bacterium]|nr:hypothetical protein [Alphaproteobacteria bacterium]